MRCFASSLKEAVESDLPRRSIKRDNPALQLEAENLEQHHIAGCADDSVCCPLKAPRVNLETGLFCAQREEGQGDRSTDEQVQGGPHTDTSWSGPSARRARPGPPPPLPSPCSRPPTATGSRTWARTRLLS